MSQQLREEASNRDNSAGTYDNDPRPTSVNDTRTQPEMPTDGENDLPVDAGATRTAAFDEGGEPRSPESTGENRGATLGSDDTPA